MTSSGPGFASTPARRSLPLVGGAAGYETTDKPDESHDAS